MTLKKTRNIGLLLSVMAFYTQAHASNSVDMESVSVLVQQAVDNALQAVPGMVIVTELEWEEDGPYWEVEILDHNQALQTVEIDATTGAVLDVSPESDDD